MAELNLHPQDDYGKSILAMDNLTPAMKHQVIKEHRASRAKRIIEKILKGEIIQVGKNNSVVIK